MVWSTIQFKFSTEPAGWNPGETYYNVVSKENSRILIPQPKPDSYRLNLGSILNLTQRCTSSSQRILCSHQFHIPARDRTSETLPADVSNIAAALNYQVHISQGALQYCDLIYHTLIGSLKDQTNKDPDLITKLEDLQKQVQQLSSKVGEINLSQKDIDQMSSKIGTVISANVQVPTAEEIASKIKVSTAREITQEIGELSLNEYTKCDLVNRISKSIPVSGLAKDIADKISIPPFKVPTAAEIASQIGIPSAAELASQMKIPSAQDIANEIHDIVLPVNPSALDYNDKINMIDRKCDYIIAAIGGKLG